MVVIGAGPIGLAAAAELRERGLTSLVFERGGAAGTAISEWNHVRLFSRWSELVSPAARRLLDQNGWDSPTVRRTRPAGNGASTISNHSPLHSATWSSSTPK
ncbi:hypothetical protein GCM10020255_087880 [Rhodococcus baikonurensis]